MDVVVQSLPSEWDVIVWNNAEAVADLAVYGRYAAIKAATTDIVYVQDDDCVLAYESFDALAAAYEPGKIAANMPERFRPYYPDSCLIGFGAIFDKELPDRAFSRLPSVPNDYLRTCDVYFTALTERVIIDVPYQDREFASAPNRMWKQGDHVGSRNAALERARALR